MLTRTRSLLRSLRSFRLDVVQAAVSGFAFGIARRLGERVIAEAEAERRAKDAWKDDEDEDDAAVDEPVHIVAVNEPVDIEVFRRGVASWRCSTCGMSGGAGAVLDIERRREQFVEDQVLPRSFSALAQAWKANDAIATNLCMLPRVGDGGVHMDLAGPLMYRELPAVRFLVIALLGVEPELATAIGKRLLNEWHDLEPHAGLTDDELDLLRVERPKENSAP